MTNDADHRTETAKVRRWAVVRIVLGNAQMAGAAASVVMLVMTGVSAPTLWTVGVTTVAMLVSIYLFRVRRYGQLPPTGLERKE